ncbi:coilin [Cocos nucifera]|uniref:Coilin n=1 Tax=Cocos nucifera TaxID=13894 RepID=A0A8K0I053_COCNU|nr:coilin [Cocos nucifera]
MVEPVRLRLEFEDRHLLTKSQRLEGLRRCWALLRPDLATIGDLADYLADCFALQRSCPHGLVLSMDEFVLPPFESTCIFKDKDIIRVTRKGGKLKQGIEICDAYCSKHSEIMDKQPIPSNDKLLTIKDSQDDSGGYKSKNEKDRRKKIKLTSPEMPITTTAQDEHVQAEQNQSSSCKKDRQKSLDRTAMPSNGDGSSDTPIAPQNDVGVRKKTSTVPTEKRHDPLEGNHRRKTCTCADGSARKSQVPANDIDGTSAKHQAVDEITEVEDEIVPIIVRPGHIRFQPLDAEQSKLQSNGPVETLQWNGTTSKKKGQKWGREKTLSRKNEDNSCPGASNGKTVAEEGKHVDGHIDFESLYPLTRLPEVGKVSSYDSVSKKIVLVPVPEYLLFSNEKNDPEESSQQPDISHYKEDGSLEIEYPSLVDVRLLKPNESETENVHTLQGERTMAAALLNNWEASFAKSNATMAVTPPPERRPNMGWEQIERALTEKKAELQQNDGWGSWTSNENTSTTSWSYRALRGSALGPTLALLRGKEAKYASTRNGTHASSNKKYAGSNGKCANSKG